MKFLALLALSFVGCSATVSKNSIQSELLRSLLEGYDKLTQPPKQVKLTFGEQFTTFHGPPFRDALTAVGWLKLRWNDARLAWDPAQWENVDELHVPVNRIWVPDLAYYNSVEPVEHFQPSASDLTNAVAIIWPNGDVTFVPQIKHATFCSPNYDNFPHGKQNCTLKVGSWTTDVNLIDIEPFTSEWGPAMDFSEFQNDQIEIVSSNIKTETKKYDSYPKTYKNINMNVIFKFKGRRPDNDLQNEYRFVYKTEDQDQSYFGY